ncbi:hypothetical protein EV361DRAFT_954108 [Lentinula raphanica]|nr:hypothetical protein F5880DRAFT_1548572 [Lentinula raphanica]KAJ3966402.1 hypothetical protein EV361DRAFT_954108 [Lentinula raphanica]
MRLQFFTFLFFFTLFHRQISASTTTTLVNVTVDDQFGDPHTHSQIIYTPAEAWSIAPNCSHCPDGISSLSPSRASNGTWHGSYFSSETASGAIRAGAPRYAELQFTGNAIYVICIIPPSTNITNRLNFSIDGTEVGSYPPAPAIATDLGGWQYGVVVYHNTSIPMASHQLLIQSGEEDGPDAIILLDSIVYSTYINPDTVTRPLPRRELLAAIVGGSVGGFTLVLVFGIVIFVYRRRQMSLTVTVGSSSRWRRLLIPPHRQSIKTQTRMSLEGPESSSRITSLTEVDNRTQSILAWQQRAQQGSNSSVLAPLDMSEELSSYYDNATTTESRRVHTPPPPPRRYIVANR